LVLEKLPENDIVSFLGQYYNSGEDQIEYDFIFPENDDLALSAPIGMYVEIANRCNLDCGHCYKPSEEPEKLPSLGQYLVLLDELAYAGVLEIRFCGNEPGISSYLPAVVERVKKHDQYLGINTNSFYGERKQMEIVDLNPDFIAFSIEGNQETHDTLRMPGSYKKTISMLERAS